MLLPRLSVSLIISLLGFTGAITVELNFPLGKLVGLTEQNKYIYANVSEYYSFRGVRYAKALTEEKKFLAPEDAEAFDEVYNATYHRDMCSYCNPLGHKCGGNVDCLYLNVYTTSLPVEQKKCRPVMFFVHGGSFLFGSGNDDIYGPDFLLVDGEVVLVTTNYRLFISGFLNGKSKLAPGNAGLKDQVQALRWVKKYIEYFGGCSENITLFGESAGSASVSFQLISDMSNGLFNRAIQQSGSATDVWAFGSDPDKSFFHLAKILKLESKDREEILKTMTEMPIMDIMKAFVANEQNETMHPLSYMIFQPSVEIKLDGVKPFLLESPIEAIIHNRTKKIPLIIGTNSDEGATFAGGALKYINNSLPRAIELTSGILTEEQKQIIGKDNLEKFLLNVLKRYTGEESVRNLTFEVTTKLISDVGFFVQFDMVTKILNYFNDDVYAYHFSDREGSFSFDFLVENEKDFCMHGDDLFYLFYSTAFENHPEPGSREEKLMLKFTKLWTNFAKTGNPTPDEEFNDIIPNKWPLMNNKKNICVIKSESLNIMNDFYPSRICFWEKTFKLTYKELSYLFNNC